MLRQIYKTAISRQGVGNGVERTQTVIFHRDSVGWLLVQGFSSDNDWNEIWENDFSETLVAKVLNALQRNALPKSTFTGKGMSPMF
jgi:hypothetical protein